MSVRVEKQGKVWTVIHSRPEARNAMDPQSADALVEAVREDRLSRLRTITVTLRTPVGGLRRFAFVPPHRRVGLSDAHPAAAALAGRLEKPRDG